jgi:membrane protein implicated in regulation of membrane protease activity
MPNDSTYGSITIYAPRPPRIGNEEELVPYDIFSNEVPDRRSPVSQADVPTEEEADTDTNEQDTPFAGLLSLFAPRATWALFNLALSIFGVLLAIAIVAYYAKNREQKDDKNEQYEYQRERNDKRHSRAFIAWPISACLLAAFAVIVFVFTQDMNNALAFVDMWTVPHMLLFAAKVLVFLYIYYNTNDNEYSEDERFENIQGNALGEAAYELEGGD